MKIYVKNAAGEISEVLPAAIAIDTVGLCIENNGTFAHYIFTTDLESKKLRRYFIRVLDDQKLGSSLFHSYNERSGFFDTTPNQDAHAKPIPADAIFLNNEEINALVAKIKIKKIDRKCPYLESSPLTRRQQDFLYSGLVSGVQAGMTFCEYLQKNILEETNAAKILQASISQNGHSFFEKESDDYSELLNFQFAFLAPNNIVRFSEGLQNHTKHQATVGEILDFFTHCIQIQLKKMNADCVAEQDIRRLTDPSRAVLRGDISHDFGSEGIYNVKGLERLEYGVFQAIMRIIETQDQYNTIENMTILLLQDNFKDYQYEIRLVIGDMIGTIGQNARTLLTKYTTVIDDVCAAYPQARWKNFFTALSNAELALLKKMDGFVVLARSVLLEKSREEIQYFLKRHAVEKLSATSAESFILLSQASLFTEENAITLLSANPESVITNFLILRLLAASNMLTKENFKEAFIIFSRPIYQLYALLLPLKLNGILNENNFLVCAKKREFIEYGFMIALLDGLGSLNQRSFDRVYSFSVSDLSCAYQCLSSLSEDTDFAEESVDAVFACSDLAALCDAINLLKKQRLLSEAAFSELISHSMLRNLSLAMSYLERERLLSNKNFNAIASSKNPQCSARFIKILFCFRNRLCGLPIFFSDRNDSVTPFVNAFSAYIKSGCVADLSPVIGSSVSGYLGEILSENGMLNTEGCFDPSSFIPLVTRVEVSPC